MISKGNRLVLLAATGCVLAAVFFSLSTFGRGAIHNYLSFDAERRANTWLLGALGEVNGDIAALVEDRSGAAGLPFHGNAVDAAVVTEPDGRVRALGSTSAAAVADFVSTFERYATTGDGFASLPGGAEVPGLWGWFSSEVLTSWVVIHHQRGLAPRKLAVRVSMRGTVQAVVARLQRELIFSLGIACVVFFAFLSGYAFRQARVRAEGEEMRFLALHDELTGLPNRKHFEERLDSALKEAGRTGCRTALFILDLDGFKGINDTLGHLVGDGLLRSTAERLSRSLRDSDLLARLSGDEFAIIVPKVNDINQITPMADRVLELMAEPFVVDGHDIMVGCSVGIAVAPDNGETPTRLLRNADFALYRAKAEGKRTWRFFNPKMAEDLKSRRMMEDGLRDALENSRFTLLYQPQFDLESGVVTGYEALLRWRLPGRGLIPTAMFLSVAEETGLIVPMGEWVIRQAAKDAASLPANVRVAINLSAAQLKRDGLEHYISQTLIEFGVDPGRIEIEVNESILGRNEVAAFDRLEKIREMGVSIVMDNFGVGTSSLGLLSRYRFDKIKVDRSFMSGIDDDQKSRAVVAAICNLGRSLGMAVAGEGVESEEHAAILRAAGCQQAQGFYFGHPRALTAVLQDLAAAPISLKSAERA